MKHLKQYEIIYGKHACFAVLNGNKRNIFEILILNEKFDDISKQIHTNYSNKYNNIIKKISRNEIDKITQETSKHQGIALKVSNYNYELNFNNILENKNTKNIFILDDIQDPHNLGNILRTTFCFNIDCIILSKHNAPLINSSVVRSSVGYSELVNIHRAINISNAINELKKNNFWIIGLDSGIDIINNENNNIKNNIDNFEIKNKIKTITDIIQNYEKRVFIFGSEGFGIKEMIKKHCDFLVKIPMQHNAESLNVGNAVAIIGYECFQSR